MICIAAQVIMCFGKLILVVGDKEELEGKIKMKGMRSKVICSWWSTNHYGWPCSSAWIGHEGSWHTGSSTGFQYYLHTQYNYSTQHQCFRRDNFHYSMYSKYCNTCWTPLNSLLLNWFVAKYMFYMYSIFAELRDDCLGEAEKSCVRRLRNCYNKKEA